MNLHLSTPPSRQRGLTLVELLIALTLGLIVIAALVAVFLSSNQNYRQNEDLAALQDNARFALDSLSRDLAMAGYWGGVRPADAGVSIRVSSAGRANVARGSATGDCGPTGKPADYFWLFDVGVPIVFRDHLDSGSIDAAFACLMPTEVQPKTDVVMIRRVAGSAVFTIDESGTRVPAGAEVVANRYYVKTNQNIGSVFRAGSSFDAAGPTDCADDSGVSSPCPPNGNPVQVYAYIPQIYYVRSYLRSKTESPKIPILCRRYLDDTAQMQEDCLAEGVENLQIEWGIGSGAVENYLANPTASQLLQARTARIHILVRSTSGTAAASSDDKIYNLADLKDFTPPRDVSAGGATLPPVLRRAFTTTVQLKNLQPS